MTSGFDAFSLGLFTSRAPAGVVAFLALALVRLWSRDRTASVRIDRMIALPFSVVLIGFIASATHLGTPANALHVFSGVGRSPLSNEVLSAVAFLFLVGSYWMMAFKERFPDAVAKPWLALACLAGIALIACTSMAYNVDTVPTWDTAFTPANLVLAALLAGPVLGLLFRELAQVRPRALERALVVLAALALVAGTVVLALHQEPFRHREQRVRSQHARAFLSCCHRRASHRRRDRTRDSRPVDEARPIPPHDTRTESHRQPARARSRLRHPHRVLPPAHDRGILIEQFSRVATQRSFADFPDFGKNFEVRRC